MDLRVLLFGPAATAAGRADVSIAVAADASAKDVLAALAVQHPPLTPFTSSGRLAVNHAFADPAARVTATDELALIAMVSGGMNVYADIIDGPINASGEPLALATSPHTFGADLRFDGVVRGEEAGRPIRGLEYTAYEPMASTTLAALASRIAAQFDLVALAVTHSRGFVAVGEASLRVTIHARHRKEALAAMAAFIDELKRDVPIWKTPVF